jgi:yecA family protein
VNHQQLSERLKAAGVQTGASEAHGIFCGMLCGGTEQPEPDWFAQLFEDLDSRDLLVQECAGELRALSAATRQAIDGPGLGFTPLLPDDAHPLAQRVLALGEWCQGFLYGLGLSGTSDRNLSPETMEALHDMAEIARVDAQSQEESEEGEEAYTELAEFIWVAAMLIHQERSRQEDPS